MCHEIFEDVDFEEKVDLVALTSITNNVYRAYEIADEFRRRGVPVVIGGFHASVEPEESLAHVDAVFIGEGEETWPEFIKDFRRGKFRRIYRAPQRPALDGLPLPRFDILNPRHYHGYGRRGLRRRLLPPVIPVQTARGCPQACDFCDITRFEAGTYRPRPVADVVSEIEARGARFVCFVDDNIFAKRARAKELFGRPSRSSSSGSARARWPRPRTPSSSTWRSAAAAGASWPGSKRSRRTAWPRWAGRSQPGRGLPASASRLPEGPYRRRCQHGLRVRWRRAGRFRCDVRVPHGESGSLRRASADPAFPGNTAL